MGIDVVVVVVGVVVVVVGVVVVASVVGGEISETVGVHVYERNFL